MVFYCSWFRLKLVSELVSHSLSFTVYRKKRSARLCANNCPEKCEEFFTTQAENNPEIIEKILWKSLSHVLFMDFSGQVNGNYATRQTQTTLKNRLLNQKIHLWTLWGIKINKFVSFNQVYTTQTKSEQQNKLFSESTYIFLLLKVISCESAADVTKFLFSCKTLSAAVLSL